MNVKTNCNEAYVVQAILDKIRSEMDRLYWNKYQAEMNSPFDNTGEYYQNDTFTVRPYYWGDDKDLMNLPNFEYPGIEVWWYKHSNRGVIVYSEEPLTLDFLAKMLADCVEALRKDFSEESGD